MLWTIWEISVLEAVQRTKQAQWGYCSTMLPWLGRMWELSCGMDSGQRGFEENHVTKNMLPKNRKPPPFWRMIYHPKTMQAAFATSPLAWHCQVKCVQASRQQHRDGTQNSFISSGLQHLRDPCAGTRQSTAVHYQGAGGEKGWWNQGKAPCLVRC